MNTWHPSGNHHYLTTPTGRILVEVMVSAIDSTATVVASNAWEYDPKRDKQLVGRRYIDLWHAQRELEALVCGEIEDEAD